ncbi:MAG: nuclear transport factor 2 family protein [Phycisphaerales bacterium]|nr:nuclear transport factor 2 family protein [Phycisphaerales bacterium]
MVQGGQILPAFERFYADDVVMQENSEPPISGKAANRAREEAFVGSVAEVHGIHLLASSTTGDVSFGEWLLDVTFKGGGRVKMAQASVRRWKNGKVAAERFYYNKG